MFFVAGQYDDSKQADVDKLYGYLNEVEGNVVEAYTGSITVVNGTAVSDGFTLLNSRSIAEDVKYSVGSEDLFTGTLKIVDGKVG